MKNVALLKQLLNEVLSQETPLPINDKFDKLTKQRVKQFETKHGILPGDDEVDETTWIKLGEVIGKIRLEQVIRQSGNDAKLIDLFGLKPNSAVIEKNDYPSFVKKDDLKYVTEGLKEAYDLVKDAGDSGDQVLSHKGIKSIKALLDGVLVEGEKANTFDGRTSTLLVPFSILGDKTKTITVRQFFINHKADVGALVLTFGGKKVMFIGHFYFDLQAKVQYKSRQAFILIHESVHLVGNLRDIDFGQPQLIGSRNLSKILVDKMFPVMRVLLEKEGYRGVL